LQDTEQENNDQNIDDRADRAQISLKSLINKVNRENILEVWRVTYLTHNSNSTPHFVILLLDRGHICTCLTILNRGIVCRHFFQVMIRSTEAQFNISLIKRRWFKLENQFDDSTNDNCEIGNNNNHVQQGFIDINGNISYTTQLSTTVLDELRKEDSTEVIDAKIKAGHLYSDLFGLGRKIAQVATEKRRFDTLDIFNQVLEELYDTDDDDEGANEPSSRKINNPHIVKTKGRPRNKRYKSSTENSNKNTSKGSNACSNCNATSHNIRRCTAPCKSCKGEGHTYTKCKEKM